MDDARSPTQRFYTRWAWLYDLLATRTPGIGSLRAAAIDLLDPQPDDVVVEMGCGSGANLRLLRERVGPDGVVVGVDFSPGVLEVAAARIQQAGWENVHVVRGDATQPPLGQHVVTADGEDQQIDSLFASLVVGMVANPAAVVDGWAEIVGPGGRVGLLDLARSSLPAARPLNGLFRRFVITANPRSVRQAADPLGRLDRRVASAHRRLHERCSDAEYDRHGLGFGRVSAGTVDT